MPVFEGLLPPPFDDFIQDLLFDLATWHAYAKLRLHTESTLSAFQMSTTSLGEQLRHFAGVVCPAFETKETPAEEGARGRRAAAKAKKKAKKTADAEQDTTADVEDTAANEKDAPRTKKNKKFSLRTYKLHALGHYPDTIRHFGTTDSYSTQTVCST
jgi:hypothetical protein